MPLQTSTLRPGILVALKTSIKGNVRYFKETIEADHIVEVDGTQARQAKWQTERTIQNAEEHARAVVVRGKVRSLITGACAISEFGLLCPEDRVERLEAAIAEARKLADDFNASAQITSVRVNIFPARIVPDDVEAVKAINSEVRDLLSAMSDGLSRLDVKVVREAANRARSLGQMLLPQAQERVAEAVEAARAAARKIVKAGEQAAQEIDVQAIRAIAEARTAFLDLEGTDEVAAPVEEGRALDLAPAETIAVPALAVAEIELEA